MTKVLIDKQGDNGSVLKKSTADTQPVNCMTIDPIHILKRDKLNKIELFLT